MRWGELIFAIGSASVIAGCLGTTEPGLGDIATLHPLVPKVPLEVAVHYDKEFRTYEIKQGRFQHFKLGSLNVAFIDWLSRALFERVVQADTAAPNWTQEKAHINLKPLVKRISIEGTASVAYELHVLDAEDNRIAVWEVFGTASNQGGIVSTETQIRQALRAAAASFIREFHTQLIVRRWLESAGVVLEAPPAPEMRSIDSGEERS